MAAFIRVCGHERRDFRRYLLHVISASTTSFAVISGGPSFYVVPLSKPGKSEATTPLVTGHKGPVQEVEFNPFNDSMVASCSDDGTAKIWGIPEGGLKENLTEPLVTLNGHQKGVKTLNFNPVANNILATCSDDLTVKVWDIQTGKEVSTVEGHTDRIYSPRQN